MIRSPIFLRSFLCGLVFSFLIASPSIAQNNEGNPEYIDEAAKILAVFDIWAKASTQCNSKTLGSIYHPQISFWPSVAKKPFYGVEDVIRVFESMCERNAFLRVSPITRYVDLQGGTAVVFGSLQFRRMLNDQLTEVPVRFSFTLTKEKSGWKILHMQSVTLPFAPKDLAESPNLK